jgi:hypothetical protein
MVCWANSVAIKKVLQPRSWVIPAIVMSLPDSGTAPLERMKAEQRFDRIVPANFF